MHPIRAAPGGVPFCLEDKSGKPAFAHIGVSTDKDNNLIVAIQQLEPFWDTLSGFNERPPIACGNRLRIHLPDVKSAECLLPESFPLEVQDKGAFKEVLMPPYTWGTTVRLCMV